MADNSSQIQTIDASEKPAVVTTVDVNIKSTASQNLFEAGDKLNKDAQYIPYMVETPIHMDANVYNILNTYRGSHKTTASVHIAHKTFKENSKKIKKELTYETVVSPSLFNPFYAINSAQVSPGVPILDNIKNGTALHAKKLGSQNELNTNVQLQAIDDCSIHNLVRLSNMENSILGQARYKYSDFMYCRDVGKISNNHLITLRRFSAPVADNIFKYTGIDKATPNEVAGDIGRLVTWFGNEENKIEDILKYTYKASWKLMEAEIQEMDSQENDDARGITGALVNLFNTDHAKAAEAGISQSAFAQLLGDDGSSYDTAPYANNPAVTGKMYDEHKIYQPKDTLRSKYEYEGKLEFNHEFSLTFTYKLRGYDNINGKTAFLDLLANILAVTYKRGTFWPGEQRIIGAPPNKQGWQKAIAIQDSAIGATGTFLGSLCKGGSLEDAAASAMNLIAGTDLAKAIEDPVGTAKTILGNLKSDSLQSIFSGLSKNALGRPAVYAFDSLLTEGNTGFWHVTIGNPLNPIASIGNLIIEGDVEISHSGPLGLDDFPTEITVTVPLKHAMPRDSVDIQRMFTKGKHAIYTEKLDMNMVKNKTTYKFSESNISQTEAASKQMANNNAQSEENGTNNSDYKLSENTLIEVNSKQKNNPDEFSIYGYIGDFDIGRIKRNIDSLGQM